MNYRKDFPFFSQNLIYLDNAATTQKPQKVIDRLTHYYSYENAPVHRGIYTLAERTTEHYENARIAVAKFIGADKDEVIFTKGTTESINFIASTWALGLQSGDEIIITELEHHSNMIPWIKLSELKNITLRYVPVNPDGTLDYTYYISLLSPKTKLVAFTACSNAIGTEVDIEFMVKHAQLVGAKTLIDAAQIIGRQTINVHDLKVDFLAYSGHKMLAPTGIGILYIKRDIQHAIEPYQYGGGMVYSADKHKFSTLQPPRRYEAGTPPIAQVLGLEQAINYLNSINFNELKGHEKKLGQKFFDFLKLFPSVQILSPYAGHIITFTSRYHHAHDIATYLDRERICVRAGNHCAQPLHKKLGVESSVRVSVYLYNTMQEIEQLCNILQKIL